MIKRVVCAGLLTGFFHINHLQAKTLELSDYMADRYEHSCAVRPQPDLYAGHPSKLLGSHILRDRQAVDGLGTLVSLNLDKAYYRNVPIAKIEYHINPRQGRHQQALYFDLTSATARQNFSEITFHAQPTLQRSKEGRFTVLRCTW